MRVKDYSGVLDRTSKVSRVRCRDHSWETR